MSNCLGESICLDASSRIVSMVSADGRTEVGIEADEGSEATVGVTDSGGGQEETEEGKPWLEGIEEEEEEEEG